MADSPEAGRAAFAATEWAEAYLLLSAADEVESLGPADLEILATAAYLSGHDRYSTETWTRAHREALEREEPRRAVRAAFWAGFGLFQRGEMAQGGGWMAQAGDLVEQYGLDCPECGYLLVPRALMCLDAGDHEQAFELFAQAGAVADRFDDHDLAALGRLGRGQALFSMGRRYEGAAFFDEVMVAVTTGEVSPVISGVAYCAVIDECQQAFDVARAHEWTRALSRWCESQPGLVPYRGQCLVHRSQVLAEHGAWSEALDEALRARDRLSQPQHPAVGMAHYQLGELRRLRGELEEAEDAYLRAQESGRPPEPGLALVQLARGDAESAAAMIDTALTGSRDAVTRAGLLPAFVEIMIAAGEPERARHGVEELAAIARDGDAPFLDAAAARAEGAVLLARADPRAALAPLRTAWQQWRDLEMPYEAAHTQVLLSRACVAFGDVRTARMECDSARRTFAQLGAALDLARAAELAAQLKAPAVPDDDERGTGDRAGSDLSPREAQVLRRVARGMTNRDIAYELFISVKTVERHLSNIFTKLDASNRTAAAAVAQDRGLL